MENTLQSTVKGTGVVAGVAYAEAVWVRPRPELPTEGSIDQEASSEAEYDRFLEAVDVVASRLENRAAAAEGQASEVLTATAGMVKDRGWHKAVRKNIRSGKNAEFATVGATDKFVTMFEAAGGVMAERTTDLKDVRDRVIAQLRGEQEPGLPMVEGQAVLFADDLAPADTATLDTAHIRALVTELGGPTSHTAIIARQLDIPCIVAVGNKLREIESGTLVFVDGALGTVTLGADEEESTKAVAEYRERAARVAEWTGPAQTKDGHRVQLLANVADGNAARIASDSQAEGIGLYRTELSFLSASEEPSIMASDLITTELVALDADFGDSVDSVITNLATLVHDTGRATEVAGLAQPAIDREAKAGTGVPGGVAIPHCRSEAVTEPALAFARLSRGVDFSGPDGDAHVVFLIAAPAGGGKAHLQILSKLARALVRKDFLEALRTASTKEEIVKVILAVVNAEKPKKKAAAAGAAEAASESAGAPSESAAPPEQHSATRIVAIGNQRIAGKIV